MRSFTLYLFGVLFLTALEVLKVYFIMPFPGSQKSNTIEIAYFLHRNIFWLRPLSLVLFCTPWVAFGKFKKGWQKIVYPIAILFYAFVAYMFNSRFLADKMFYQPKQIAFVSALADTTNKDKLVIGLVINHQAKAYPIQIIGYHHQVQDTLGGERVMVTYCTVCRTGRVYSPIVNGRKEKFRLVGMDHFNAMFEDGTTGSWWQQATGVAIAGKLKGQQLTELPSVQMKLGDWISRYPASMILQPDTSFKKNYADLTGFDEGTIKGKLEHRDSLSWQFKSWVVGVNIAGEQRAYDWNELVTSRIITDTLGKTPLLLTVEPGGKTFYVMSRSVNGQALQFAPASSANQLEDQQTHSIWNLNGKCVSGALSGTELQKVQSYQEFWHSWKNFNPKTSTYHLKG